MEQFFDEWVPILFASCAHTHKPVGDGIHIPADVVALFHCLTGGSTVPRKVAMHQWNAGKKRTASKYMVVRKIQTEFRLKQNSTGYTLKF